MSERPVVNELDLARRAWRAVQVGDEEIGNRALATEVLVAARTMRLNSQVTGLDRVLLIAGRIVLGLMIAGILVELARGFAPGWLLASGIAAVLLGVYELPHRAKTRRLRNAVKAERAAIARLAR